MSDISESIRDTLITISDDQEVNVADAIIQLGDAIRTSAERLGNNKAGTEMGAIEAQMDISRGLFAIRDSLLRINGTLSEIADHTP